MKILFVDMHRAGRSPSQRFRYEQYLEYLSENGVEWEHSYLLTAADDKVFYRPGNYLKKFIILLKSIAKRLRDIRRARQFDVVFIQREAFMLGTIFFERRFAKSGAKLIFDFDDAIWLSQESKSSAPNKHLSWLKNPDKTKEIIAMADLVIAGNQYLADYALQFNSNVTIVPTTIDTDQYIPKSEGEYEKAQLCIGWSGSKTTIDHFEEALPVLEKIKEQYGQRVTFKVIGDGDYKNDKLDINGDPWKKESEVEDLKKIDIGIMPLPDDEWAKGKCGLKGLQYMALGIPTLMSPVGVNTKIINHGENGYLPMDINAWLTEVTALLIDKNLRKSIGTKGRESVVSYYSQTSQKNKFLKLLINN